MFKVSLEPEANKDIQDAIEWYNDQALGLGDRFKREIIDQINELTFSPFYQIRYEEVRCLPLPNFPFMIHFTIQETHKQVIVHAIFNTYQDPKRWEGRR